MNTTRCDLRIGILGTAAAASYVMIAPARTSAGLLIEAVGSRELARAQAYAKLHGISRATDYDGLIADPSLDAIYIALPNSLHTEWSIKALQAGKAVLCEKPLGCNALEASASVAAARSTGRILVEAFHWRCHPLAARLSQILTSRALGRVREIATRFRYPSKHLKKNDFRLDYSLGGGVLMDAGCYCINLLRMLLGEPVALHAARARLAAPDVDVHIEALLEFGDGVLGRLVAANDVPGDEFDIECLILGDRGCLKVSNPFLPHLGSDLTLIVGQQRSVETIDPTPSYNFQAANFAEVVRGRAATPSPAEDAIANMAVVDMIYRSAGLRPRGEAA